MKTIAVIVFLAAALPVPAEVTLMQAIENGLRISPTVANQALEEQAAEIDRVGAARQRLFQLNFNGSYRFVSQRMEISSSILPPAIGGAMAGSPLVSGGRDNWDLKLGLSQPIWMGGLLDNAEKLQAFRRQAEAYTLAWRKVELAGRIKTSYFTLQLLQNRRQSLRLLLDSLDQHLRKLENFYREELVRRSDLLETRLRRDEAGLALTELEGQIAAEQVAFRTLCGYEAAEVAPGYREGELGIEAALARFEAANPLLAALAGRLQMAGAQRRMAAAGALPQVAGFAELHYARPGVNLFASEWKFYVQAGLGVTLPLFNWNRAGRERQQADLAAARVENQRRDLRRETERGLRQLEAARRAAVTKLQTLDGLIAAAAENSQLKEKLYAESQTDNIDYLDAVCAWERYRSQREELLAQLELIKVNVHTLVGVMGE